MARNPAAWDGIDLCNGRYCSLEKLGEGGMGYVYKARDKRMGRFVVIKVPRAEMLVDSQFRKRFVRELQSLVKLEHRHIVPIQDYNQEDKIPFAVMRYLPQGDLHNRRSQNPQELKKWLKDIASALDFVHKKGYVHRDVKPGNILFDDEGYAYLSDFGIAKVVADSEDDQQGITKMGFTIGTPEYMAPELHSNTFDGRIDQYALAVTVYELLSGETPYRGSTPVETMFAHKTEQAEPIPNISAELNEVISKGMAKEPGQRYVSCSAFAEAVLKAADNKGPVKTPPLPRANRAIEPPAIPDLAARPRRKERTLVPIIGLVVVALTIIGAGITLYLSGEAKKQRLAQVAEEEADRKAKAKEEARRKAKERADRRAREEADRIKAKKEADRKAREEARQAKERADRRGARWKRGTDQIKAKEEADRKAEELRRKREEAWRKFGMAPSITRRREKERQREIKKEAGRTIKVTYHENGEKKKEYHYKNGEMDGLATEWRKNGKKSSEIHYKDGKRDGLRTGWYENGKKRIETHYKDGKQEGLGTWWHENGKKQSETNYNNGKEIGRWTMWYKNGQKKEESHYKNGKRVSASVWKPNGKPCPETKLVDGSGIYVRWYENGKKKSETHYKNDKEDGLWTMWYENGQKKRESHYKNGKEDGLETKWWRNGQKRRETHYKNGERDGPETHWDKKGRKTLEIQFKDGVEVSRKEF